MSVEHDTLAIQRIEQLAAAAADLPALDVPVAVLPGGTSIRSLEEYLARPKRRAVTFKTERITDFIAYVAAEADEHSALFVNPTGNAAQAIIDFGSNVQPMWGAHTADLALRRTPEFQALEAVCTKRLTQRELLDWLEDWVHVITPMHNGEAMPYPNALTAIRRVDIKASRSVGHEEGDFRRTRSSLEEIDAKAAEGNLPERFSLKCALYDDTEVRTIEARLSLLTGDDKPGFRLRIMGEAAIRQQVAAEVETKLREALDSIRVYVGSA